MNDQREAKLLPCQLMFGRDRGDDIIEWIETATKDRCPCKRMMVCPLVGEMAARVEEESA